MCSAIRFDLMRSRRKSGLERGHSTAGIACPTTPKLVITFFTVIFAYSQGGLKKQARKLVL
jgi:hypothetical protein